MSPSHGSEGLKSRRRVRDARELRDQVQPDSPLGLTDEGRRVLAALAAMDLLPPHPPEGTGEPGPHER